MRMAGAGIDVSHRAQILCEPGESFNESPIAAPSDAPCIPPTKIKKARGRQKAKRKKTVPHPKPEKSFFTLETTGTYLHNRIGVRCGSLKFFRLRPYVSLL